MKKGSRLYKIACLSAIAFAAWILLAPVLAKILIIEKPLMRADAILVLAGSATYKERTEKAADFYNQGVAPRILLTDDGGRGGWSRAEQRNPSFVELAKNELTARGVPAENVEILQPPVSGTIYEARVLREKLEQTDWKKVLIVTSAYHTRRAAWTFEHVLANDKIEIGVAGALPGLQTPPLFTWWLSVVGWQMVAGEYVKSAYYWIYY